MSSGLSRGNRIRYTYVYTSATSAPDASRGETWIAYLQGTDPVEAAQHVKDCERHVADLGEGRAVPLQRFSTDKVEIICPMRSAPACAHKPSAFRGIQAQRRRIHQPLTEVVIVAVPHLRRRGPERRERTPTCTRSRETEGQREGESEYGSSCEPAESKARKDGETGHGDCRTERKQPPRTYHAASAYYNRLWAAVDARPGAPVAPGRVARPGGQPIGSANHAENRTPHLCVCELREACALGAWERSDARWASPHRLACAPPREGAHYIGSPFPGRGTLR